VLAFALAALLLGAPPLDRVQVYSIRGADCADCGARLVAELKKLPGVKKASFDKHKVELTLRIRDDVDDASVSALVEKAGLTLRVGGGQGAYLPPPDYPAGSDVVTLTRDGSKVGALDKLRVPGKFTVFDFYADWCGPCREVDERLRELVAARGDVAVRRLNVVDFDSPLARELGPSLDALPYLVVFDPNGKRGSVSGLKLDKLEALLKPR
jgi:thiol-disulfide isomerase/thioredoxin/copper chaperone CopZ